MESTIQYAIDETCHAQWAHKENNNITYNIYKGSQKSTSKISNDEEKALPGLRLLKQHLNGR